MADAYEIPSIRFNGKVLELPAEVEAIAQEIGAFRVAAEILPVVIHAQTEEEALLRLEPDAGAEPVVGAAAALRVLVDAADFAVPGIPPAHPRGRTDGDVGVVPAPAEATGDVGGQRLGNEVVGEVDLRDGGVQLSRGAGGE